MDKETLIDNLLAFLSPVVAEGEEESEKSCPQVAFISFTEVQLCEAPGFQLPTNKVFESNPLIKALSEIANYDYDAEEKNYIEALMEEDEDAAFAFEEEGTYDHSLIPGHIYHSLRYIKEMIEAYEKITGDISHLSK
jgi:hypothetical protein